MNPPVTSRSVRPVRALALAVALALGGTTACSTDLPGPTSAPPAASATPEAPSTEGSPTTESQPPKSGPAVVAVSVDGLNPDAIARLGPDRAPTLHRLLQEGASTLSARTSVELTTTLPNHTGMLTGRRVEAATGGHGVTVNEPTSSSVHDFAGHYVASVFDVVHDHGGSTALFATKPKFSTFDRSWRDGAADTHGPDDGRDKIDRYVYRESDARLLAAALRDVRRRDRDLTFIHLSAPDKTGHESGFMGRRYLDAVAAVDSLLRDLVAMLDSLEPTRPTVLLLTSDHGGDRSGHGTASNAASYTIPFLAWGPGVPAGADLYALNPRRTDPGDGRPFYEGPQPIRNTDLANTVTAILGLGHVPGSQIGAKHPVLVGWR